MPKNAALPHYLRVALALSAVTGCGGGTPEATTPPTLGGNDAGVPETSGKSVGTSDGDGPISKVDDYTGGEGPCRCSWDTNATGAPRVCKKGETAYNGTYCKPGPRPKYGKYPVIGPLSPPDLPC